MKRVHLIGTLISMLIVITTTIIGCQIFDDSPTEVSIATEGGKPTGNFIMGNVEINDWGINYTQGNTFVMVNIPVAGAMKIEYRVTWGGTFALFVESDSPVEMEVGLMTRNGVTDVLDSLCVTYQEDATFASIPSNSSRHKHGEWIHYKRVTEEARESDWWKPGEDFVFSGDTITTCGVVGGLPQWTLVYGPFEKPSGPVWAWMELPMIPEIELLDISNWELPSPPVLPPLPDFSCQDGGVEIDGHCWYLGEVGQSCNDVCDIGLRAGVISGCYDWGWGCGDWSGCEERLSALGVPNKGRYHDVEKDSCRSEFELGCVYYSGGGSTQRGICESSLGPNGSHVFVRRVCACNL